MQDVRLSYCSDCRLQCTDRTSGQDSHAPRTAHKNRLHAAFINYPGAIRKTSSGIGEKMIYFMPIPGTPKNSPFDGKSRRMTPHTAALQILVFLYGKGNGLPVQIPFLHIAVGSSEYKTVCQYHGLHFCLVLCKEVSQLIIAGYI